MDHLIYFINVAQRLSFMNSSAELPWQRAYYLIDLLILLLCHLEEKLASIIICSSYGNKQ